MSKKRAKPAAATRNKGSSAHDTPTDEHDKRDRPVEIGGRKGLEPTRFGDWEKAGRCIDF